VQERCPRKFHAAARIKNNTALCIPRLIQLLPLQAVQPTCDDQVGIKCLNNKRQNTNRRSADPKKSKTRACLMSVPAHTSVVNIQVVASMKDYNFSSEIVLKRKEWRRIYKPTHSNTVQYLSE
jgi:hypothetical protein